MRRLVLTSILSTMVLAWSGLAAAQKPATSKGGDPEKVAAENLRKAQDVVHKTQSGLSLLKKTAWASSILTNRPELKEFAQQVGQVQATAKELDTMVGRLNRAVGVEQKKESKSFLDKLKLVKLDAQADEVRKLADAIRDLPVGLVGDDLDDKFRVSADLLIKRPKEAEARFAALLKAMETNIEYLEERGPQLRDLSKVASQASKYFKHLDEGIEKAVGTGVFTATLVGHYLDVDKLMMSYAGLAIDAETKAKEISAAITAERRRHDNLKDTVQTLFGFRL